MSKCHLSFDITGNKKELMVKAKDAIIKSGGKFEGDDSAGHFTIPTPIGKIVGDYTINGDTFILDVLQKPLLVSCKRIETEISKHMQAPPIA